MSEIDRLIRKRPHSPPEITSTPIQNEDSQKEMEREFAPSLVKKRPDYLQWEEYFMAVAFLSAQRSKDPNSQVLKWLVLCHVGQTSRGRVWLRGKRDSDSRV